MYIMYNNNYISNYFSIQYFNYLYDTNDPVSQYYTAKISIRILYNLVIL